MTNKVSRSLGGIGSSEVVGLNETEWRKVTVTKTIRFPQTSKLGVRFENLKPNSFHILMMFP